MRFKSRRTDGYQVFAVSGTNTVSFAIDFKDADTKRLLGFAVERIDATEDERYYVYGFKVFPSVIPNPDETTSVKTFDHPIQSFVWDDFTAKDGRPYQYLFHPLKGTPKHIDRSARPIAISIRTEPLFSNLEHDIFFNRGVASSQAYTRKFGNKKPVDLDPANQALAREWLSRKLDDALLKFIRSARKSDGLLCCFYEFRYAPVADAIREAVDRGVAVRLIVDAKVNAKVDKKGKRIESFPREENLRTIENARLPRNIVILREARPDAIAHNKFMVLLKGSTGVPSEVWTGSTNVSDGGIHGQTNVGHWVRDTNVAARFKDYWDLLSRDPGPQKGAGDSRRKNLALRRSVEGIAAAPATPDQVPTGITPVFSPRTGTAVLDMYARMLDEANDLTCITLAFGISATFKTLLKDNTKQSHLALFLLEKQDRPKAGSRAAFVGLNAGHNVYQAWGAYLRDRLYQWTRETNATALALNKHVSYVHSKFLLRDPLGTDPVVVTGSANFSKASTIDNDENMLIIRGNARVADIYFTEFNRLFNHYYFRSIQEVTRNLDPARKAALDQQTLFLAEDDAWLAKYRPGGLKYKRVEVLTHMKGCTQG